MEYFTLGMLKIYLHTTFLMLSAVPIACYPFNSGLLLSSLLDLEEGGDIFLRNFGSLSPDYSFSENVAMQAYETGDRNIGDI
jgi:hypothetical protein